MAYFGVTASAAGLHAAAPGEDLAAGLRRRLRDGADGAPVVVLVHGFKFHPDVPGADPHRSLFALRPAGDGRRIRSWPEGLGFRDDAGESGLCVGFAWPASAPMLGSLVTTGRTGFARVYDRAAGYGARLAELVALLAAAGARAAGGPARPFPRRPGGARRPAGPRGRAGAGDPARRRRARRPGAGLRRAPAGRRARRRSTTSPPAPTTSTTSPSRPSPRAAPAASGRWGSGSARRSPQWLDLQLDRAEVTAWVNGLGIPLTAASARLCHWGFYTRGGALAVYEAILRRRPGWDIASLRAAPCFTEQEPRWSRLLPRRPAPPRPPRAIGESLTRA